MSTLYYIDVYYAPMQLFMPFKKQMVEVLEFVATNFARNIQMDKLTSNALVPLDTYPSYYN